MKNNLMLSEHAKERLRERYELEPTHLFVRAISNPLKYKLLSLNQKDEIRGIDWKGTEIQYIVNSNTVKTFIPPNYERNEEAIKFHNIMLDNIRKTETISLYQSGAIKHKVAIETLTTQLKNQKDKITRLGELLEIEKKGSRNRYRRFIFNKKFLPGIFFYIKLRREFMKEEIKPNVSK